MIGFTDVLHYLQKSHIVANAKARKISLNYEVKQQFYFEMSESPAYKCYIVFIQSIMLFVMRWKKYGGYVFRGCIFVKNGVYSTLEQ